MLSLAALLAVALSAPAAQAQSKVQQPKFGDPIKGERRGGPLGLGIAIGAPTGVSGKVWMGDWMGLQFSAGGDLGSIGDFAGTIDYVVHIRPFNTATSEYSVPLYFGGGFVMSTNTQLGNGDIMLGPRGVAGLSVLVKELPTELFFEVAPSFLVYETVSWSMDGQIGVRYYF